ncbi:MAG: hypothetical protein V1753_06125 [Pseudomonadota bacterium]
MKEKTKKQRGEVVKGFFLAYLVLFLNVLIALGAGLVILFFKGVFDYLGWIFFFGAIIIGTGFYFFIKRMKEQGKTLRDALSDPIFAGRSVEIDLLGGLFAVRFGRPNDVFSRPELSANSFKQIENSHKSNVKELTQLAFLLEKKMISEEEFAKAKEELLRPLQSSEA